MTIDRRRIEQQYPSGSRVYYYDMYEITDGPDSLTVDVDVTFSRDRNGVLHVTDTSSGYTWTFSRRATVERKVDVGEKILPPGQAPDEALQRLISLGGARLGKQLAANGRAVSAPGCSHGGSCV